MPGLYRDHDIFLFPTLWAEPFGLAALEAMACGCLVLATGSGGSGEFLKDGETALLFPPNDADAVAEMVVRLVTEPGLVAGLRSRGRSVSSTLTFEAFAAGVDATLERALAGGKPA
jgi:glycosyltransferase involved in cell wall biosynthesis